jgi:signal peptidase I
MFSKLKDRRQQLKNSKPKLFIYITSWILIVILFTIVPAYCWMTAGLKWIGITSIRGNSMSPTIVNNDIMYVQPVEYERGAIVVALCPNSKEYVSTSNAPLLKRIIGLPGETIELTKDGVLINGELLQEEYVQNVEKTFLESNNVNELILSDHEYFLMGDNRVSSFDSRHVGPFHRSGFLYGLTTEPNEYTFSLWIMAACVCICNVLAIVLLPNLILIFLTYKNQPKTLKNANIYKGTNTIAYKTAEKALRKNKSSKHKTKMASKKISKKSRRRNKK